MNRRELITAITLAAGLTAHMHTPAYAGGKSQASFHAEPQGFTKSGNPHAAGGPGNPGVGNPFNAY